MRSAYPEAETRSPPDVQRAGGCRPSATALRWWCLLAGAGERPAGGDVVDERARTLRRPPFGFHETLGEILDSRELLVGVILEQQGVRRLADDVLLLGLQFR